jgi:NAD(P)-dependent dehydrogenase (short-subunit alcohol dehydrogenase family)
MDNLKGKKVVVLGGSAGMGLATAKAAAVQGAEIIIVSSNQERINKALSELPADSEGFAVNLGDEQAIASLFKSIGNFDHLVYTAGESLQLGAITDTVIEGAKKFFDIRYWGAFTSVKYAAPNINEGGSITLTGGSAAHRPGSGWSLGASICSAMEGFTRAMAIELAPIRVNIVVPGLVKTDLWADMAEADREGMYAHYGTQLPVRYIADADDLALSYIYLMQQTYSTGQVVVADGGYVLV